MSARLHGFDRDSASRHATKGGPNAYDVVSLGTKANMSDVAAAIAQVQLERREELHKRRSLAASWYIERLANSSIQVLHSDQRIAGQHAEHLMIVRFPSHSDRNAHATRLRDERIGSSLHFQSLHTLSFWRDHIEAGKVEVFGNLQNAESYAQCSLSLPLFPDISRSQVDRICDILLKSTK
jgi:dTDP-4-amino-4,6-dideoxygalactose transaminase